MKKKYLHVLSLAALATLATGCGSSNMSNIAGNVANGMMGSQSSSSSATGSILGAVLGSILGQNNQISQEKLIGTWKYQGSECKFESENLLKQAGGEFITSSVESKIDNMFSKIGIKKGTSTVTFEKDGTCSFGLGGRTISGTYEFDQETGKLVMTGTLGLMQSEGYIVKNNEGGISILFNADKLLDMVNFISSKTSSTSIRSISSLLGSYDGIKVGMNLKK